MEFLLVPMSKSLNATLAAQLWLLFNNQSSSAPRGSNRSSIHPGYLLYQACFLFNPFKPTWYLPGIQQIVFARLIWRKGTGGWCTKSSTVTDWESKPRWKCLRAFLITTGQAKVSKDRIVGGFLIVCSADPAGFLVARSGVYGTRQGQCHCRRLRVAQLHAS